MYNFYKNFLLFSLTSLTLTLIFTIMKQGKSINCTHQSLKLTLVKRDSHKSVSVSKITWIK